MGHSAYSSSADNESPHVASSAACGSGVDPMGGHTPNMDSNPHFFATCTAAIPPV